MSLLFCVVVLLFLVGSSLLSSFGVEVDIFVVFVALFVIRAKSVSHRLFVFLYFSLSRSLLIHLRLFLPFFLFLLSLFLSLSSPHYILVYAD